MALHHAGRELVRCSEDNVFPLRLSGRLKKALADR